MKLISTIFSGDIEVTVHIQSRTTRGPSGEKTPQNEALVTEYRSKIGNVSLIFNPSVVIILRNRNPNVSQVSAMIPVSLFYRFTSTLSGVYQSLQKDKLFHSDSGVLYLDQKAAINYARKLSLFKNSLTIIPEVHQDRSGKAVKGIGFRVDGEFIGTISHSEGLCLIDVLDHLDINTFSLLAGVVDELDSISRRTDIILDKVSKIENILLQQNHKGPNTQKNPSTALNVNMPFSAGGLDWSVVEPGPFGT